LRDAITKAAALGLTGDPATDHFLNRVRQLDAEQRARDEAELMRLAALSPLEYDRARAAAAEGLGCRTETLDREVARRRPTEAATGQGQPLHLPEIEPADHPVNGEALLTQLTAAIERHVVLPAHASVAIALWILWSHVYNAFDIAPRLALLSPEKRCGKTTLLRLLAALTPKPLLASNVTPAALFRTIETASPTLLVDEFDSFGVENEELRGLLNSGHNRDSAFIVRVCGDDHEPRKFSTWAPIVIAAIGSLPDTILDRSIVVPMRRKLPSEKIAKLTDTAKDCLRVLARSAARWAKDREADLRQARPDVPAELNDRGQDNWYPLLCVAHVIGGEWPERARQAAVALSGTDDPTSTKTELLADIRAVFEATGADRLSSVDLCDRLAALQDRPWAEWRRGKPLTPAQLARLLKPFGVSSRNLKQPDGSVLKGYEAADFNDTFNRYLPFSPESPLSKRYRATSRASSGVPPLFQSATREAGSVSENARNPSIHAAGSAVAFPTPLFQGEEGILEVDDDVP
jgi:putative DNA primase/helicase